MALFGIHCIADVCFLVRLPFERSMRACDAVAAPHIGTAMKMPCMETDAELISDVIKQSMTKTQCNCHIAASSHCL